MPIVDTKQILLVLSLFLTAFACDRVARRRPPLARLRIPLLAAGSFALLETARGMVPRALRLEALGPPLDFLFFFSLAVVGIRLVQWIAFDLFLQRHRHLQAPDVLKDIVSFAIYVIVFFVLFQRVFQTSLTPLLATSAVFTAVIGLAMQDSLGNLFAGISLRMEESLKIGDWVGISGSVGRVVEMRWRALKLVTIEGDVVIFPNSMAAKERVENYSQPAGAHGRRIYLGVAYSHPPAAVIGALIDLASRVPGVLAHPTVEAKVADYQDSSIRYEIKYWLDDFPRHRQIEGEIRRLVWYRFQRDGIEIPFPLRTVRIHHEPDAAEAAAEDASRAEARLKSVEIFSPLSDEERGDLARRCRRLRFAPGEVIVRQGDRGASFYVIGSGRVQVFAGRDPETSSRLNGMGAGDFFGEISLLTGEPRTATVLAESDVVVYEIGSEAFHEILVARPSIAESLSVILGKRQVALQEKLREMPGSGKDARADEVAKNLLQRIRSFFRL